MFLLQRDQPLNCEVGDLIIDLLVVHVAKED